MGTRPNFILKNILFFLLGLFAVMSSVAVAQAPKKVVAVSEFENKANYRGQLDLGYGMADMLTDALIKSGQFIVLERQGLDAVMAEQNLAASGRAAKVGGAAIGDIKRAQILVQGAVTEFEESAEGGGQGLKLYGFRLNSERAEAHVAIIIRLIDTTTSQVMASQRVEGTAARGGMAYGYSTRGFGFNQSGFKATPLEEATQIAIDNAVAYIAAQSANIPWTGKVIKVENGMAYVNAGHESNIPSGAYLMAFRPKGELIDPDTGMNLGGEESFVGRLQVVEVRPKFSKARVLDSQPAAEGDIVRFSA